MKLTLLALSYFQKTAELQHQREQREYARAVTCGCEAVEQRVFDDSAAADEQIQRQIHPDKGECSSGKRERE